MISSKKTIAIAGIAVLVLAVAGPVLADILAAHQAQAIFGRGFGFGGFGGPWRGGGCGCGCCLPLYFFIFIIHYLR